jgi:hypothetical protein
VTERRVTSKARGYPIKDIIIYMTERRRPRLLSSRSPTYKPRAGYSAAGAAVVAHVMARPCRLAPTGSPGESSSPSGANYRDRFPRVASPWNRCDERRTVWFLSGLCRGGMHHPRITHRDTEQPSTRQIEHEHRNHANPGSLNSRLVDSHHSVCLQLVSGGACSVFWSYCSHDPTRRGRQPIERYHPPGARPRPGLEKSGNIFRSRVPSDHHRLYP